MIHVSRDFKDASAEKWAAKEKFPWLTILPDDVKRSGMAKYTNNTVPHYALVNAAGEKVESGYKVLAKIKNLK